MRNYNVGVLGCTGMVGQRFCLLLSKHPYFKISVLAASGRSAGKTYAQAVSGRWAMKEPVPEAVAEMPVYDAVKDMDKIVSMADFVFCAVSLGKEDTKALEESYAKRECPVISNNSANRFTPDVPMIIPELNPGHAEIIEYQRRRLGTKRGFIAVKSNCSLQSYLPALLPLDPVYGLERVLVCTYQAISGIPRTFDNYPEIADNVIPYIGGEEEKSELEPLKIMGKLENGAIAENRNVSFTSQCLRVPVSDGHLAAVFAGFRTKPQLDRVISIWNEFSGEPQKLGLPSAPKRFLHYFSEPDRPQTRLDRDLEGGMAVSIGRLRYDTQYDIKFVCLSHNTLRGAAGGGVLCAELLCEKGYI